MEIGKNIAERFKKRYGVSPEAIASAPGRVNLIGEHTDYNLGWVLPMAIDRRVWAAGRIINDKVIRMSSENLPGTIELRGTIRRQGSWGDYPLGVMWSLSGQGIELPGLEIHFWGDVPIGGGLSSSAAIEVVTAVLLQQLCGLKLHRKEIARSCQVAEYSFVGVRCGPMDQMAAALSRKDHALCIDCRDLSYDDVPLNLGDYRIAVINSGVRRELGETAYNSRRAECQDAAKLLNVKSLRALDAGDFPRLEALPSPLNRRARHVLSENHRVTEAVGQLREGDMETFGRLMNLSHLSMRNDYEVSTPELDYLVEKAIKMDGVLGARLTGAGFGGCIIALAHKDASRRLAKSLLAPYRKKWGKEPDLIISFPDDGARVEL